MKLLVLLPLVWPARVVANALVRLRRPAPRTPDAIAVLGTAQYDGRPSRQLVGRLDGALDLAVAFEDARVYTLGGSLPGDRFTEAGVSADYLAERGVDPERITVIPVGSDTRASLAALVEKRPGTVALVTDPLHALRAELTARAVGLDAFSAPTPYCPSKFPRRSWWHALAHESGGLVVMDVFFLAGEGAADRLKTVMRTVEGLVRPSRRARHAHLRTLERSA